MSDLIPPDQLRVSSYPERPQGGQVAGVEIGVKVEHLPTGLIAIVNFGRSQHRHKEIAVHMIEAALTHPRFSHDPLPMAAGGDAVNKRDMEKLDGLLVRLTAEFSDRRRQSTVIWRGEVRAIVAAIRAIKTDGADSPTPKAFMGNA